MMNTPEETESLLDWKLFYCPDCCKGVEVTVGVDEAGRGPVLGSLVYAIAFWPSSENESISKLAFNDSKQLKETERESLLKQLQENGKIGWAIEPISAQSISEEMLRASPVSLNAMSYEAVIRGLKAIAAAGPKVGDVFVDTVGDPDYYKSRLISALGNDFAASFTIEKKADSKFKVVSAASIVAKVTRDRLIRVWKWHEPGLNLDKNFGSGYPSDEVCVEWLNRAQNPIFGYPDIVRFSWATAKDHLTKTGAATIRWECDDEDTGGSGDITGFFLTKGKTKLRTNYFSKRKMARLSFDHFN